MKPGATTNPAASMAPRPSSGSAETARILPPEMPKLRVASRPLSGSSTRPCRITRSYVCALSGVSSTKSQAARIAIPLCFAGQHGTDRQRHHDHKDRGDGNDEERGLQLRSIAPRDRANDARTDGQTD